MARRTELHPIPAIEMRIQDFRPRMSLRGAHAVVTTMLRMLTKMLSSAEDDERRVDRRLTPYMMMELMPQSCWANMTATTAMVAGL
jgi:hypothetical protein